MFIIGKSVGVRPQTEQIFEFRFVIEDINIPRIKTAFVLEKYRMNVFDILTFLLIYIGNKCIGHKNFADRLFYFPAIHAKFVQLNCKVTNTYFL